MSCGRPCIPGSSCVPPTRNFPVSIIRQAWNSFAAGRELRQYQVSSVRSEGIDHERRRLTRKRQSRCFRRGCAALLPQSPEGRGGAAACDGGACATADDVTSCLQRLAERQNFLGFGGRLCRLRLEAQATEDRNVSPVGPCEAIPRCGLPDALIGKLLPCLVAFLEVRKVHGPEHFGGALVN